MALVLPDRWVWDFWFAHDGGDVHVFYLQAPRELGDPELRHHHASVGHAVSSDLRSWKVLADALSRGSAGEWDDLAVWTGSVVHHGDDWAMLYTGIGRADGGRVQRIGLATSPDLTNWDKHPGPVIEADERWYEKLSAREWREEAWRDPFTFVHDGRVHALITARSGDGPIDERGVIGHARSTDLRMWEVLPPLDAPREFAALEVMQLVSTGDRYYLVFSAPGDEHSMRRVRRMGGATTGSYYLVAGHPLGPFAMPAHHELGADASGSFYGARLVEHNGGWWLLAFRHRDETGAFLGGIADPVPVSLEADGSIRMFPSSFLRSSATDTVGDRRKNEERDESSHISGSGQADP